MHTQFVHPAALRPVHGKRLLQPGQGLRRVAAVQRQLGHGFLHVRRLDGVALRAVGGKRIAVVTHRGVGLAQFAIHVGDIGQHGRRDRAARALDVQAQRQVAQGAAEIAEPAQRRTDVVQIARLAHAVVQRAGQRGRTLEARQRLRQAFAAEIENAAAAGELVAQARAAGIAEVGLRAIQRLLGGVEAAAVELLLGTCEQCLDPRIACRVRRRHARLLHAQQRIGKRTRRRGLRAAIDRVLRNRGRARREQDAQARPSQACPRPRARRGDVRLDGIARNGGPGQAEPCPHGSARPAAQRLPWFHCLHNSRTDRDAAHACRSDMDQREARARTWVPARACRADASQ
ncbi:hypothetical protein NB689_003213 [Xanthomonas sacchari]|nr:hypothetical protein [Xanthomonas sacchari]